MFFFVFFYETWPAPVVQSAECTSRLCVARSSIVSNILPHTLHSVVGPGSLAPIRDLKYGTGFDIRIIYCI
jgi:hypothetical protein